MTAMKKTLTASLKEDMTAMNEKLKDDIAGIQGVCLILVALLYGY